MGLLFWGYKADGAAASEAGRLFHISVRTIHVHSICSDRTLPLVRLCMYLCFLGQCPLISYGLCVNSRTFDIGKSLPASLAAAPGLDKDLRWKRTF